MGGSALGFIYRQCTFKPKPLPKDVCLRGKTALVTGASGGLGLEACKELCEHGLARLIMGARDITKGETAKREIVARNDDVQVEVWNLDQESFESIKEFTDRVAQLDRLDRLDIAILSAGVKIVSFTKSRTGHERNVQVRFRLEDTILGSQLSSLHVGQSPGDSASFAPPCRAPAEDGYRSVSGTTNHRQLGNPLLSQVQGDRRPKHVSVHGQRGQFRQRHGSLQRHQVTQRAMDA